MNKYAGFILKAELIAFAPILFFLLDGSVRLYVLAAAVVFFIGRLSAGMPKQAKQENRNNRRSAGFIPAGKNYACRSAVAG